MKNNFGGRERTRKGERDWDFYRIANCFFCFFFWEIKTSTKWFPSLCFLHFFSSYLLLLLLFFLLLFFFFLCVGMNSFYFYFSFCSSFKVNLKVHLQELARRLASGAGGQGSGSLTKKQQKKIQQKSRKSFHLFAGQKPSAASVPLRNKTTSKQFWVKNCLINTRVDSRSSPAVFTFFRQCKVFW